jgi:ParB family chromosome partitioning protein
LKAILICAFDLNDASLTHILKKATMDFNFKQATLGKVPLSKIRENAEALRTTVEKDTEDYKQLVDSVSKRGLLNPILVREIKDPVSGETLYGLIDGLHRFNAAMDAGLTEIPAQIGSLEEGDLLEAQILANVHRIETKPVQYSKALIKILGANPLLTMTELAGRLSRSSQWLTERLGLVKLHKEIQEQVDSGTLGLTNAYALAKLPEDKQKDMLQQAISKSPAEFVPMATQLVKELAQARREGRKAETDKFVPTARLQRLAAIRDEADLTAKAPDQSKIIASAKNNGVTTVEGAIAYALSWVLHLDPVSVAADQAKWEADKAQKAEAAEKRKVEKEKKKSEAAANIAAAIS